VNVIEAIEPCFNDFGNTHICFESVGTHPSPQYNLLLLSHGQSLALIHGIVLLNITPQKYQSSNHLIGSSNKEKVFQTPAPLHEITISA
jgi:hypothetical protein